MNYKIIVVTFLMLVFANIAGASTVIVSDTFTDGDYTNSPTWTVLSGSPVVISNHLVLPLAEMYTSYNSTKVINDIYTMSFDYEYDVTVNSFVRLYAGNNSGGVEYIAIKPRNDYGVCYVEVYTHVHPDSYYNESIIDCSVMPASQINNYKLTLNANTNLTIVYINNVEIFRDFINVRPNNVNRVYVYGSTTGGYVDNILFTSTSDSIATPTITQCTFIDFSVCSFYDIGCYFRVLLNFLYYAPGCYFTMLLNSLYAILYNIVSIPIGLITSLFGGLMLCVTDLFGMITDITSLGGSITGLITNTIGALFPSVWTALIILGVTLVILLRIYSFLKDISIFGFKI